jgi:TetR/AcrR family transcriptional regulator
MEAVTEGLGTKTLILQVALLRFSDTGFHATSLNDIAAEVGIRRQSLLHHFPSKEMLYEAVVAATFADWIALVEESVAGEIRQGWPQVELTLRAAFRFFEEHPEFVRLLRREAIEGGPILNEWLAGAIRPMFDRGAAFLQREMDAGRLRVYDPAQLLLTGYGAVLSYLSDAPLMSGLIDDAISPAALAVRREHVLDVLRNAMEP